ncbi:MAG: hypothetical protein WCT85_01300 [Parachlamydiales bacterium]|jgi:hypothetical protein
MDFFSLSIYLAQLIGLVFFIIGIAFIFKPADFQILAREAVKSYPIIIVVSSLRLIVGLAIILAHNLWVADWRVLITILGWMSLIMAIAGLYFLKDFSKIISKILSHKNAYVWIGTILSIIGAYLAYNGFYY